MFKKCDRRFKSDNKDRDAKSTDSQATETDLAKVKEDGKQKDTFKTALAQLTGALRSIINHNRCQCVKIQRKNYAEMLNNDGTELLLNCMP